MSDIHTVTKPVIKLSANNLQKVQVYKADNAKYPYRLQLNQILQQEVGQRMVFHVAGDTGGLKKAAYQQQVIDAMSAQIAAGEGTEDAPLFLFHLGDVVYNYGEEAHYYEQFFEPFENYPVPIIAVPGNHDGDIDPLNAMPPATLHAFLKVFCDDKPQTLALAGDTRRQSMAQPNVYFTLCTPLANIIGLYSNVSKFGFIDDEQSAWFLNELKAADEERPGKALLVCLHHSPFSADSNHGSSTAMRDFLDNAFAETGIKPDMVLSGHVHDYQRFERRYPDGTVLPFIVAGAGGYADLHSIVDYKDPAYAQEFALFDDSTDLIRYNDRDHGFLKISIERTPDGNTITGEYFVIEGGDGVISTRVFDSFQLTSSRISPKQAQL